MTVLTPNVFYKHIKHWVSDSAARPVLQHVYFDGERAMATDTFRLALVKDWPCKEAHFCTPDGQTAKDTDGWNFPEPQKLIPDKSTAKWRHEIDNWQVLPSLLNSWKDIFVFLKKLVKKADCASVALKKQGARLIVYAVDDMYSNRTRIILLDGLDGADWEFCIKADYILRAVEFLKDSDPESLEICINENGTIMKLETPDMILLISNVRVSAGPLRRFLNEESSVDADMSFLE
ncbi:MAG: hypothetical protein IKO94_05615 [Selenomonadaceae bacterium]|nr:hypothetical protein [Selenomonadaceae bacterium]